MLHNCYMYITSIICNMIFLLAQQQQISSEINEKSSTNTTISSMFKGCDTLVFGIIVINASIGIMTSLFLKTFNSILKTFVSAVELMLTAIFSYVLFGIPIYLNTGIAIFIVSGAIILYAMNPLQTDKIPFCKGKCDLDVQIKDNQSV